LSAGETPPGSDRNIESDLTSFAEVLQTIRDFLNVYVNDVFPYVTPQGDTSTTDQEPFPDAGPALNRAIEKCEARPIDEMTMNRLKKSQMRAPFLNFENSMLNWLIDKIKKLKDLKKWLPKIFKALNIILDSLMKVIEQLGVVKEFKDHLSNASDVESISTENLERDIKWEISGEEVES